MVVKTSSQLLMSAIYMKTTVTRIQFLIAVTMHRLSTLCLIFPPPKRTIPVTAFERASLMGIMDSYCWSAVLEDKKRRRTRAQLHGAGANYATLKGIWLYNHGVSNAKCGEDRKCHPTIDVDASFDAEDPGAAAFEGVPPELHMKVGGGNCTNSLHASRLRRQHLIKKAETLLPQLKLKHEPRRHKLLSVTIAKTRATMKRKAARYAAEFPPKRKAKAKAAVAVEP